MAKYGQVHKKKDAVFLLEIQHYFLVSSAVYSVKNTKKMRKNVAKKSLKRYIMIVIFHNQTETTTNMQGAEK